MRGGKRPGAGRPRGAQSEATKTAKQLAAKATAEGITPHQVLLRTMRELYANGDKEGACKIANLAAPYSHPKLSSVEASISAANSYYLAYTERGPDGEPILGVDGQPVVTPADGDTKPRPGIPVFVERRNPIPEDGK